ncbi:MAG: hypothetical protein A2748_02705 [Candidatus Wildermuthbacteria bacterium RIFCSPHIGHO2_01_FULL_45_20]|nr:MAG: hypothetical protein A2748_02705 [Candidatus Wildermuthbacteria bacterium RIFCSPHIGHO2_01_FULL_45_20]
MIQRILPQIDQITRDTSISHFLLMFGYRMFSFYFPLFLIEKGYSVPQIGYVYLFIYLPIALAAPFVGFLNHKINPALLTIIGIAGYAGYALSMLFAWDFWIFLLLQVMLGIAAACYFVSSRAMLMGFHLKNPNRSFGWFYSSSLYVDILAPALGALLIWFGNFYLVFLASLIAHVLNVIFVAWRLYAKAKVLKDHTNIRQMAGNFKEMGKGLAHRMMLAALAVSLATLFVTGIYRSFFFVFLREEGWQEQSILLYGTISSIAFALFSLLVIKRLGRESSVQAIREGGGIFSLTTILLGFGVFFAPLLNFVSVLIITLLHGAGGMMVGSGKSGLLSKRFFAYPEEAGALDTIFAPLASAFGSLAAGLMIGVWGFGSVFMGAGMLVGGTVIAAFFLGKRNFG